MNEAEFRELLDERGLLRGGLAVPDRTAAFTVFAQTPSPTLDSATLKNQATRFFAAKVGLTVEKKYGPYPPVTDAARIVLSGAESGTRLCFGRPATEADLAAAELASQGDGLALLAQRCPTVWLIVHEGEDDRVALTLAAILASVLLGPILSPSGDELFGVRTARAKLEGRSSPYR